MGKKNKKNNLLTKKEQATTVSYKMMSEKISNLEASLKKTQDESSKLSNENHELDKKNILLEERLKNNSWIEVFKFVSSGGIGFSINYFTNGNITTALSVGIPSFIIFLVCIVVNKK